MTETAFERDIAAQPDALRRVMAWYAADGGASLVAAGALAADTSQVMMVAMGSSLSAALPAVDRISGPRTATAHDAGELLHYGQDRIADDTVVVLVSQSGRSIETLTLAEHLRARGHARVIAVTNDPAGPLAELAAVTLPMLAGDEATVATKTYMTTFIVLHLLASALGTMGTKERPQLAKAGTGIPANLPDQLTAVTERKDLASAAALAMGDCTSLAIVARGPTMSAADYGALIMKETAALSAQSLTGGAFRHGPLEISGPAVGMVVMAPSGPTRDLAIRLAQETSDYGSPTWLIGDDALALPPESDRLRVTTLPAVDEAFAPLLMSVPVQRLAAALARQRGRVPGVLLRSSKVTETE